MAAKALLATTTITTAVTNLVSATMSFDRDNIPEVLVLDANFVYGSGGTTAKFWVQTSFDGGTNWMDIYSFAFTTSSLHVIGNLNARTPVTTPKTFTDATLADNT